MMAVLLTGEFIRSQVLLVTDSGNTAVDVPAWLRGYTGTRACFSIVGRDTEHTSVEQFEPMQFAQLLRLIVWVRYLARKYA